MPELGKGLSVGARAKHDRRNNARNEQEDQCDLDCGPVEREEDRSDELSPESHGAVFLLIARGHENRRAVLLEKPGDLVIVQGPAELGGAIVDLGLEIGGELSGDVFALPGWEPEFNGGEVAIE
jgi:hypothetical protein